MSGDRSEGDAAAAGGDEPDTVEVIAASDGIVAHGPQATADVAAAVKSALGSLEVATANRDRLRNRLWRYLFLAVAGTWLGIGLAREWSEPRSWGWLWDVVAPLAATAWALFAFTTAAYTVFVAVRVLRRRPGQSVRSVLADLSDWSRQRPEEDSLVTMYGLLFNSAVLGVTGLALWPSEPYGDWNVVVPPVTTLVAIIGLVLFAELVVLTRHRSDPRDLVVEALYQTYATAMGVAVAAGDPVDWRQSRGARVVLASGLEAAADLAERDFKRIAPRRLALARQQAGELGRRIAAGFRVHAHAVLLGGRERDDRLAPALAGGLVAASRGEWEELAQTEPASAAPRIITAIAQRVVVAALVVGAGLLVAEQFGDVAVQEQLREVFISASLLALITPRSALQGLSDRVRQTLTAPER